jgi:hypothetical protein
MGRLAGYDSGKEERSKELWNGRLNTATFLVAVTLW